MKSLPASSLLRPRSPSLLLLLALEHEAKEAGVGILRLETNRTLVEAIHLYRDSGYQEVEAFDDEAYAHHWFEKRL